MKNRPTQQNLPEGQPSNQDELRAENEVLKLKLEMEFGMERNENSLLDPEIENQWLTNIYNFEKQYKEAKRIKLYDFLGRPTFQKIEDLKHDEIEVAMAGIQVIMEEKGVELDCCMRYDPAVIYKFITEELFDHEIDDMMLPGFVHHFIYEEFHPNHDYDLRRYTNEFIEILLRRKLSEFDEHRFADRVRFKGTEYDRSGIFDITHAFQKAHRSFKVERFKIQEVIFDAKKGLAEVHGHLQYAARGNGDLTYKGSARLDYVLQFGSWSISGVQLPGFGD